jgi:glycosyltransferase involved in cell wall biosynthesis
MVPQLGLEGRVAFLASQSDVASVYAAIDALVVSSTYEGCSNVILEAMGMAKPVIATAVGGNPELVSEQTGLLVPPGNPQQLARAMVELLRNRGRMQMMGQAARLEAERRFSLSRMVRETEAVYDSVLRDAC